MSATDLSTADVLRRAKQVLIKQGWRIGGAGKATTGPCCAMDAISTAIGHPYKGHSVARDFFVRANGIVDLCATWNDQQESVEPVLAAFDRAIALAESEAS